MTGSRFLVGLALLAALGSCSTTPAGKPIPDIAREVNATLDRALLRLQPGDKLSVRFTDYPDWDHETFVLPDGTASFLSLDNMPVVGLTLEDLDDELSEAYAKILTRQELTVLLTRTAVRQIYVLGEVQKAGSFPMPDDALNLIQALGLAGGAIRDTASLDHMLLVRWRPDEQLVISWTIDASPEHWNSPEAIILQPHDVIYVPAQPVVHVNDWIDRYIRRNIPFPYLFFPTQ